MSFTSSFPSLIVLFSGIPAYRYTSIDYWHASDTTLFFERSGIADSGRGYESAYIQIIVEDSSNGFASSFKSMILVEVGEAGEVVGRREVIEYDDASAIDKSMLMFILRDSASLYELMYRQMITADTASATEIRLSPIVLVRGEIAASIDASKPFTSRFDTASAYELAIIGFLTGDTCRSYDVATVVSRVAADIGIGLGIRRSPYCFTVIDKSAGIEKYAQPYKEILIGDLGSGVSRSIMLQRSVLDASTLVEVAYIILKTIDISRGLEYSSTPYRSTVVVDLGTEVASVLSDKYSIYFETGGGIERSVLMLYTPPITQSIGCLVESVDLVSGVSQGFSVSNLLSLRIEDYPVKSGGLIDVVQLLVKSSFNSFKYASRSYVMTYSEPLTSLTVLSSASAPSSRQVIYLTVDASLLIDTVLSLSFIASLLNNLGIEFKLDGRKSGYVLNLLKMIIGCDIARSISESRYSTSTVNAFIGLMSPPVSLSGSVFLNSMNVQELFEGVSSRLSESVIHAISFDAALMYLLQSLTRQSLYTASQVAGLVSNSYYASLSINPVVARADLSGSTAILASKLINVKEADSRTINTLNSIILDIENDKWHAYSSTLNALRMTAPVVYNTNRAGSLITLLNEGISYSKFIEGAYLTSAPLYLPKVIEFASRIRKVPDWCPGEDVETNKVDEQCYVYASDTNSVINAVKQLYIVLETVYRDLLVGNPDAEALMIKLADIIGLLSFVKSLDIISPDHHNMLVTALKISKELLKMAMAEASKKYIRAKT